MHVEEKKKTNKTNLKPAQAIKCFSAIYERSYSVFILFLSFLLILLCFVEISVQKLLPVQTTRLMCAVKRNVRQKSNVIQWKK